MIPLDDLSNRLPTEPCEWTAPAVAWSADRVRQSRLPDAGVGHGNCSSSCSIHILAVFVSLLLFSIIHSHHLSSAPASSIFARLALTVDSPLHCHQLLIFALHRLRSDSRLAPSGTSCLQAMTDAALTLLQHHPASTHQDVAPASLARCALSRLGSQQQPPSRQLLLECSAR